MNRIYWQSDRIGMLTDHLNANKHTHWMLQLFLSLDRLSVSLLDWIQQILWEKRLKGSTSKWAHTGNSPQSMKKILSCTSLWFYRNKANFVNCFLFPFHHHPDPFPWIARVGPAIRFLFLVLADFARGEYNTLINQSFFAWFPPSFRSELISSQSRLTVQSEVEQSQRGTTSCRMWQTNCPENIR